MDRTPLQHLQDELLRMVRAGGTSVDRQNLDGLMVRAFDAGIAATKELAAETARHDTTGFYVVSAVRDRIESTEDGDLSHYQGIEDAGDAVVHGHHGEAGTRYVLRVKTSVERIYDRGWAIVKGTRPAQLDDDLEGSPTSPW